VQIVNGDTPVENGNIMFISEILFVSEEVVNRLHQQNRDKETPPLLAYTWMNSPFISHAYLALQKDSRFTHVTRYINLADVAPVITGHGKDLYFPKTKIKELAFPYNTHTHTYISMFMCMRRGGERNYMATVERGSLLFQNVVAC
jgi:hypothetical protein